MCCIRHNHTQFVWGNAIHRTPPLLITAPPPLLVIAPQASLSSAGMTRWLAPPGLTATARTALETAVARVPTAWLISPQDGELFDTPDKVVARLHRPFPVAFKEATERLHRIKGAQNLPIIYLFIRLIKAHGSFLEESGLALTFLALVLLPPPSLLVVVIFPYMLAWQLPL
jgi:hypothetical protein